MKYEKEKYFSCYSPNLKEYLEEMDLSLLLRLYTSERIRLAGYLKKFPSYLYILNSGLAIASKG